jgi:hypothetical protein
MSCCSVLLTVCQQVAITPAHPASELKVMIAIPDSSNGYRSDLDHWWPDQDRHIDVIIENISARPLNIYDSWNSWGFRNVRLEWQADGKSGTVMPPDHGFSMNSPTTTTLFPGCLTIRSVPWDEKSKEWPEFRNGMILTLRAVYEEHRGDDFPITLPTVWEGKEYSQPVTFDIQGYFPPKSRNSR